MKKFNVGDRVKYNGFKHDEEPCYYPVAGTIGIVKRVDESSFEDEDIQVAWPHGSTSLDDMWWCKSNCLTLVFNRPVIVISVDKDNPMRVIAKDKSTGEIADAVCNPDDEFDFYVGAKLAFDRLVGETKKTVKCKFKVGDIIIGNKKANRYGITVEGWIGRVVSVHEPKPGRGCDVGRFTTFRAESIDDDCGFDLCEECFDLSANSKHSW